MRLLPRLALFLFLAGLTFYLFHHARVEMGKEEADMGKVVGYFCGVVLIGVTSGILFVVMVMPMLGDVLGNLFFQPNEQIEKNPHADALGAVARGEYAEAVEEYRKVVENDPTDTLAYSEIAKISCEHLDDPAGAAETLETALQQEWPPDDAAFLSARLVDVYWNHQHDARSARAMLLQIIEAMPGTRHSANAQHKLKEIEEQIALEG